MNLRDLRKQAKMSDKQNNLKERRLELKLTQKEVAEKLGVADSAYQRYEGGTRTPSVIMAIKIAKILQTTVEDLFG